MKHLPQGFIDFIASHSDSREFAGLPKALMEDESPVSVRLNRAKGATPELFPGSEAVPWCDDGLYLAERPRFTLDPAMHQGLYYVQDASSMAQKAAVARAVSLVASADGPLRFLDACAAPGGKTTASLSALPRGSFIVANEFDPRRTSILYENTAKWGAPVTITRGDASAIKGLDEFFDIVAADVPCSGEGMMRKDEQAINQWSPELIAQCAARQRNIVDAVWRTLRHGGVMIYSTCTFNTDENECIVSYMIDNYGAEPVEIPELVHKDGICGACAPYNFPAYRFLPGSVRGEGLFLCMLRKPGDGIHARVKPIKKKNTADMTAPLNGDWTCIADKENIRAIPTEHLDLNNAVCAAMNVVGSGIELGEMKGRDFIPSQSLALSIDLKREVYPEVEVDLLTALHYLRRETIILPEGTPRGIVLLTYNSIPLGFCKNLGNRANNLYPSQWRILKNVQP